jgi:hypothetical protein
VILYPEVDLEVPPAAGCGCLPFSRKVAGRFPAVGEVDQAPIVPEDQWVEYDLSDRVGDYTYDQGSLSTCCPNASAGAMRMEAALVGDPNPPILSAEAIHVLAGAGPNQGLEIGTALEILMKTGVPTVDLVPLHSDAFNRRNWKTGWEQSAAENQVQEAFFGQSYEAAGSMGQRGLAVVIGVFWQGGGGHAIFVVGYQKQRGVGGLLIKNSWGKSYGTNGVGWLSRSACSGIATFGCYGIRSRSLHTVPIPRPAA